MKLMRIVFSLSLYLSYLSSSPPHTKKKRTENLDGGKTPKKTYLSTTNLVKTRSRLKKTGFECSWLTALSINGCDRMKFNTVSGRLDVSSTHVPGRGSGIFDFKTGNHAELDVACSLNLPVFVCQQKYRINTHIPKSISVEWGKINRCEGKMSHEKHFTPSRVPRNRKTKQKSVCAFFFIFAFA